MCRFGRGVEKRDASLVRAQHRVFVPVGLICTERVADVSPRAVARDALRQVEGGGPQDRHLEGVRAGVEARVEVLAQPCDESGACAVATRQERSSLLSLLPLRAALPGLL